MRDELEERRGLVFIRPCGGRIKIGTCAFEVMLQYAQHNATDSEGGGVLLGRHILNTRNVVVDEVTTPMPEDKRSRARFIRHRWGHQVAIDNAWRESHHTCTYLGEWHTHPEYSPKPSLLDKTNWWRKLMVDHFSEVLFFVIVGTGDLRMWEGSYRRTQLNALVQLGD